MFHEIETARKQDENVLEAAKYSIERNANFSHLENILLNRIAAETQVICELSWHRTLKARDNERAQCLFGTKNKFWCLNLL